MKRRMRTLVVFAFFGVLTPAMPSRVALAGSCTADAEPRGYHVIEKNRYMFKFAVHSGGCGEYPCRGFVKFAVKFHYADDTVPIVSTDRSLMQFTVAKGQSQVGISDDHYVTTIDRRIIIDDVTVESVSCSSP